MIKPRIPTETDSASLPSIVTSADYGCKCIPFGSRRRYYDVCWVLCGRTRTGLRIQEDKYDYMLRVMFTKACLHFS